MRQAKKNLDIFLEYLAEMFPEPECALQFGSPFQLLVATMLSAQCTDKQVNIATPALFAKYPDAHAMAVAPLEDVEKLIHSTGFYKNKAKNIIAASKELTERYGGEVPADMESLTSLPGVGRKTANVVLGNAFGVPGMVVDTHVMRISQKYGLTDNKEPEKIEQDLMKLIKKDEWTNFSHRLVLFGRAVCSAKKPDCINCKVSNQCQWAKEQK